MIGKIKKILDRRKKPEERTEEVFCFQTEIRDQRPEEQGNDFVEKVRIGKVHETGRRTGQQDCFGIGRVRGGLAAAVADGMGGLEKGEMVSQTMIRSFLQYAEQENGGRRESILRELTQRAARDVDEMLGSENLYKSGSTFVAVLAEQGQFHWISVGDSRIYLYRGGTLKQLNQDHIYERELMELAERGLITLEEVKENPQREYLTSFIGMGELKYIDGSREGVQLQRGDRILLVTDGIYKTLPEERISQILVNCKDAETAAVQLRMEVEKADQPYQDNFTALILDFNPVLEGE